MISLVRVDDRLIHGQVTVGWVPHLRATQVIVVNDRLAADRMLSSIVRAGGSRGLKVDVMSVPDTARLFSAGAAEEERVILLFEGLADVLKALEAGLKIEAVNIGGLRGDGEGLRIGEATVLTPADQAAVRGLSARGIRVEVRLMPGEHAKVLTGREEHRP